MLVTVYHILSAEYFFQPTIVFVTACSHDNCCSVGIWQALGQYDSAARDLLSLQKIEPKNSAAKKELKIVLEMCRKVFQQDSVFISKDWLCWDIAHLQ